MTEKKAILGLGPTSLTGAGLIHFDTLQRFSTFGHEVFSFPFSRSPIIEARYPSIIFESIVVEAENSVLVNGLLPLISVQELLLAKCLKLHGQGVAIIIFASYLYPYAFVAATVKSILGAKGIPCKLITQPAGSDIWKFAALYKESFRNIFAQTDIALSYSDQFAGEVNSSLATQINFLRLPPVIDTDVFCPCSMKEKVKLRSALNIGTEEKAFIAVSNNRYVKGIRNCIGICERIAQEGQKVLLLIVGPETPALQEALNQKANIRVVYCGQHHDVRGFLNAADVFINASYHDSFNSSLCEALSVGLPVISSSLVGMREFIGDKTVGYFFSYEGINLDGLRSKTNFIVPLPELQHITRFINDLLSEKKVYEEIALAARDFVQENFSWFALEDTYRKVLL